MRLIEQNRVVTGRNNYHRLGLQLARMVYNGRVPILFLIILVMAVKPHATNGGAVREINANQWLQKLEAKANRRK